MVDKNTLPLLQNDPWYKDGLHFKCTGCGGCCTGAPGYVWLNDEDIRTLSSHLKLSKNDFLEKYCFYAKGRYSLRDLSPEYDCIFLHEKKACSVYPARPRQCRVFPWWKDTLSSQDAWDNTAKWCEGINHPDGKHFSQKEIEESL